MDAVQLIPYVVHFTHHAPITILAFDGLHAFALARIQMPIDNSWGSILCTHRGYAEPTTDEQTQGA